MEPGTPQGDTVANPLVREIGPAERAYLDDVFSYHAPTPPQLLLYTSLRASAMQFAETIMTCCPPSADRSAALRHLREAVMTANASVALGGRG